jgi:hypothetical protein
MSEIPFVKALGDEIERSAAERIATRRKRIRRRLTIGGLGFAIAATGVAAASGVFSSPESLANNGVACFDRAALNRNVTVLAPGDQTPIEACRAVLKTDAPLVACADEAVHVFPGGPGTCEKLGMAPLPPDYEAARQRVNAFGRAVTALEHRVGCLPPREFAERVQRILDRTPGWEGWSVDVREDLAEGPCSSVTAPAGDGSRSIAGTLSADERKIFVIGRLPRALENLLYSADGLAGQLMDASGERCYDIAGLEDLARERLARADLPLSFSVSAPRPESEIEGARGDRLAEGCPVIIGVGTKDNGRELVVGIWD